ncbi:MAG TPA: hypothetical protein ACFYD1_07820 [Candidatus Hypogeohydataceae bacterium YC38]
MTWTVLVGRAFMALRLIIYLRIVVAEFTLHKSSKLDYYKQLIHQP